MSLLDGGLYSTLIHSKQGSSVVLSQTIYSGVGYFTLTVPDNATSATIVCYGGGAGGEGMADSGSNSFGGDGGGGGGYAQSTITVSAGEKYSYNIGDKGLGSYNTDFYGTTGGTSFFGPSGCTLYTATVRAVGGGGGQSAGITRKRGGGTGSLANLGDITYTGGYGANGVTTAGGPPYTTAGGGGCAGPNGIGIDGSQSNGTGGVGVGGSGNGGYAGDGANGYGLTNGAFPFVDYGSGFDASGFGGGGGGAGAVRMPGGETVTGGDGAQGLVIITFYT